jgi:MFS transporter, DHA3 family, macrolide efflux protein
MELDSKSQKYEGFNRFKTVWIGQLLSLFGSNLTGFGLSVWVYQQTGSPAQFGFIIAAAFVPILLLSPIAGIVADRYSRKRVMLFGDLLAGVSTLIMATLYFVGLLEIWHIFVAVLVISTGSAFQIPAYAAMIPQLVRREHLVRANGLVSLAEGTAQLVAPAIAGFILSFIGLGAILIVDLVTVVIALVCLSFARTVVSVQTTKEETDKKPLMHISSFIDSLRFLKRMPAILILIILFSVNNVVFGVIQTLIAPYMLGFASTQLYGLVLSFGSIGMIVGSIIISIWSKIKRKIFVILTFNGLLGIALAVLASLPNLIIISTAMFVAFLSVPFIDTPAKTIVQTVVPERMHGRIFAVRNLLESAGIPIGATISGPLAENFFEPAMMLGGSLTPYFGWLVGEGTGRGIALMFLLCGLVMILATILISISKKVRNIENTIPSAVSL